MPNSLSSLEVSVHWASLQRWKAGQQLDQPPGGYALWVVQEGRVQVYDGEKCYVLSPGEMLLWPATLERRIVAPVESQWLSVGLSVVALGHVDVMNYLPLPHAWRPAPDDCEAIGGWMQQMIDDRPVPRATVPPSHFGYVDQEPIPEYLHQLSLMPQDSAADLLRQGLARAIFARCWRLLANIDLTVAITGSVPLWVQNSIARMRDEKRISIADLAHATGFSPAQFRRRFHTVTGLSPRDYLARLRFEKARRLLETTNEPIRVVAAQCGFQSVPHFIENFQRKSGLSPARYRASVTRGSV